MWTYGTCLAITAPVAAGAGAVSALASEWEFAVTDHDGVAGTVKDVAMLAFN